MIISQMIALKLLAGASESEVVVTPPSGGHFIPGLAGVRAGKKRPKETLEVAEQVLDEVVAEVLDTPNKPVQRVSRRLKSQIIDLATQRLLSERVLIGEIDAIDRAAANLAKLAIKRRIEARKKAPVTPIMPGIQLPEIIPDNDQDIASFMFRVLDQPDPEREEILAQLEAQKETDDELILLMQILLTL